MYNSTRFRVASFDNCIVKYTEKDFTINDRTLATLYPSAAVVHQLKSLSMVPSVEEKMSPLLFSTDRLWPPGSVYTGSTR